MSVLLIDVGNSRLKWRLQGQSADAIQAVSLDHLNHNTWPSDISQVLVASVREIPELITQLRAIFAQAKVMLIAQPIATVTTIQHCYDQPQRLGVDRWLAMLGARAGSDEQCGWIVVDAGSALTIDLLSAENRHLGGYIVPGVTIASQALFANTDKVLPYQDEMAALNHQPQPGTDTVTCVFNGITLQRQAMLQTLMTHYPDYQVVVTGGDGELLAQQVGVSYCPDLIFKGLESLCVGSFFC